MSNSEFTPYQYSIIRYHHDSTTHEFLNIGVSLFAPAFRYFRVDISTRYSRITDTFYDADGDEYRSYVLRLLRRFNKLSEEVGDTQPEMFKETPDDIEMLLRTYLRKDSSFRYSIPASGITMASLEAIDQTFNRLFDDYVNRYIPKREKESRTEDEVWRGVYKPTIEKVEDDILNYLHPKEIITPKDRLGFDYSWKNGRWHLIQPISFDLVRPGSIVEKAHRYLGKNVLLNSSDEVSHLYLLLGEPWNKDERVNKSYSRAKDIMSPNGFRYKYKLEMIEESDAEDFARYLRSEIHRSL